METNLIKNMCTEYNLSQIDLSRRFGIPYRTVQDWYAGKRTPPEYVTNMMIELLDIYKIDLNLKNISPNIKLYGDLSPLSDEQSKRLSKLIKKDPEDI